MPTTLVRRRDVAQHLATPRPASDHDDTIYREMRERVAFDRNRLDDAVERHAQDFLEISERLTMAQSRLDEAKDELGRKDSEIAREYRKAATKAGDKCTDSMTDDHVRLHKEHIGLAAQLGELKKQADNWKNLQASFEHRKRMLQEMVALYLSGYYADNAGSRSQMRDASAATARAAMAERRRGAAS